jgi:hypothetical protein
MVTRIRVEDLGDEVRESLERGEAVEIERDGKVVASIPAERPKNAFEVFLELRRQHEPVDEDFERDLEQIRKEMNRPIGSLPWE